MSNIPVKIDFYSFFRYVIPGYFGTLLFLLSINKINDIESSLIILIGLSLSVFLGITNRIIGLIPIFPFDFDKTKKSSCCIIEKIVKHFVEFIIVIIAFMFFLLLGNWHVIHLFKLQKLINEHIMEERNEKYLFNKRWSIWKCFEAYRYWQDKYSIEHTIAHSYANYLWFFNNTTTGLFFAFVFGIIYKCNACKGKIEFDPIMIITIVFYIFGNILSFIFAFNLSKVDTAIIKSNKDKLTCL